ncbi:RadC family protein [Pedobacter sp. AW31-3R]|uniref:RadC family protein n=1 Tax=Pedobacter sp. AW31-3R TaxID=3445781 RepID=UPI003FA17929
MVNYKQNLNLKSWAEADRPREKLLLRGRRHLTDAELIAILIRSGNAMETAVDLSKRILNSFDNDLEKLGQIPIRQLLEFKGVGEAKALSIIAALELGRRRKEQPIKKNIKVTSSRDVYEYMLPVYEDLQHEEFWILMLNRANKVISRQQVSKGGQAGTVADPKMIFNMAIEHKAAFIILTHNHPSGNATPSQEDISITKKLIAGGKMLDLLVLDHLIITNKSFYSLCDEGII